MPADSADAPSAGPLAWLAANSVTANLLMVVLLVGGLLALPTLQQEVFPEVDLNRITVTVAYPGAGPSEVEDGIVLALEEAVRGIDGVKEVRSVAQEGFAIVVIELFSGASRDRALSDVKNAIDRIASLPEDAEEPVVSVPTSRAQVLSLVVHGELEPIELSALSEQVRRELLQDPRITQIEVAGLPPPEISIEVPSEQLRRFGLTLEEIARRVDQASIDLPGGALDTPAGEVLLRTTEERTLPQEFARIIVASRPDGTQMRLGEIADVEEILRDSQDERAWYDGEPAARLQVFRVGEETPLSVAAAVDEYVERASMHLPESIGLAVVDDTANIFRDRMNLLLENGRLGVILVLLILGLFLHPRLAFWVTLGIPACFLGAFLVLPLFDISINMISLFAFLLVLGIVVDDAIVVGEATFTRRSHGEPPLTAAVRGVREVLQPVVFAVLTTSLAFIPMLFLPGVTGEFFWPIPVIVISILSLSLLESLAVLPAHLAHVPEGIEERDTRWLGWLTRAQRRFTRWFERQIAERYHPAAARIVDLRYVTLAAAAALLALVLGLVLSGRVPFSFLPRIEGDIVTASVELPFGAPPAETERVIKRMTRAARDTARALDGDVLRGVYAQTGTTSPAGGPGELEVDTESGAHLALVQAHLAPIAERDLSAQRFSEAWRRRVGEMPGVERLAFAWDAGPPAGAAIAFELTHEDPRVLESAAQDLAERLGDYGGVRDIDDGFAFGKPQLDFTLEPAARAFGLTESDLAQQVRSAFFGAEAQRRQRGRFEVRVYVRRPQRERTSVYEATHLILRTPDGGEIPMSQAARIRRERSATQIERTNGRRTIEVTADVQRDVANAGQIMSEIEASVLPELRDRYPGLRFSRAGEQEEQAETFGALARGMSLALLAMYALMAAAFKSYVQPLIVLAAIPFGLVGAVLGHLALGFQLSMISMLGLVALAGVVVNDSLVLIAVINDLRREGASPRDAVVDGCARRFRPILLTSLTTFFGLAPIIFETSLQARFLIPMALSLGVGVLFVTLVLLVIAPAGYMVMEDLLTLFRSREPPRTVH